MLKWIRTTLRLPPPQDSQKVKTMKNVEINLNDYAAGWAVVGPLSRSGPVTEYRPIPGGKTGQEIWLNNTGNLARANWQYRVFENGEEVCRNQNFNSAEDALIAARERMEIHRVY